MFKTIKSIVVWWNGLAGKHPFFTFDKFAHGWLHTMIVVFSMNWLDWYWAFLISILFGIAYELLISKDLKDSLRDLVWNTIGGLIGLVI